MKATAAAPLAPKDKVRVYQKPHTRESYEGDAKLIRLHAREEMGFERWIVRFSSESANTYRLVHARDRVEGMQRPNLLGTDAHKGKGQRP